MSKIKVLLLFILIANIVTAQTRQVSGVVADSSNTGIPSATVKVKGSKVQSLTGTDGSFTVSAPSGNIDLEISSIGFGTKNVSVAATDNNV